MGSVKRTSSFKRYTLILLALCVTPVAALVVQNVDLDPDEIYSHDILHPFISRDRGEYTNAGVINSYAPRSIIVGGSLIQNVIPSEVEAVLDWEDSYSLTLPGPSYSMQGIKAVVDHALRKHNLGNVMIGLNPNRLAWDPVNIEIHPRAAKNFLNLYNANPVDDIWTFFHLEYHANRSEKKSRFHAKLTRQVKRMKGEGDIFDASRDNYSHYMGQFKRFNRPLQVSSLRNISHPDIYHFDEDFRINVDNNLRRHVTPLVRDNPNTRFTFVIVNTSFLAQIGFEDVHAGTIKMIVKELASYPNVEIYSFLDAPFNSDLRLYKDLGHAHIETSRYMLAAIRDGRYRLTSENVEAYVLNHIDLVANYKKRPEWEVKKFKSRKEEKNLTRDGTISEYDAARLIWGERFSPELFASIYRSKYVKYSKKKVVTKPPLEIFPESQGPTDQPARR